MARNEKSERNEIDIAWAAGFIEGEGSICFSKNGVYIHCTVSAYNTDKDVLERLPKIFGVGSLREASEPKNHLGKKQGYVWKVSRKPEIVGVLRAIRPYLGERRGRAADAMLSYIGQYPRTIKKNPEGMR